jgi:hypothetical protein
VGDVRAVPRQDNGCNASALLTTYLLASTDPAATDASLRTTCEGLRAGCVAGGVTSMCENFPSTCTATVSEYNTCVVDTTDGLGGLPDCSTLTRASLSAVIPQLTTITSPAWMSVEQKCPSST